MGRRNAGTGRNGQERRNKEQAREVKQTGTGTASQLLNTSRRTWDVRREERGDFP